LQNKDLRASAESPSQTVSRRFVGKNGYMPARAVSNAKLAPLRTWRWISSSMSLPARLSAPKATSTASSRPLNVSFRVAPDKKRLAGFDFSGILWYSVLVVG
jgi:hypothetical protein